MFSAKQLIGVLIGSLAIYAAASSSAATIFLTNNTSPKTLAPNESDAGTGLTTGGADDGNNNGLDRDRTGNSTVLSLSAEDGGGPITFTSTNVSGNNQLFMDQNTMGHGNAKWGSNQNWTFTLDQTVRFDGLDFAVNESSYSLRSVAWKDDAAASGTGWSFTSDGTIGIFSLTNGQIYDFTSAGVSNVSAGTEIGFGAFGGANGGELLRSFTITVIPEPSSLALIGLGSLLVAGRRSNKR
ncbi:MAG: PEP-CTERM sorting domain-containing protein [Planctomycetota bacterium]